MLHKPIYTLMQLVISSQQRFLYPYFNEKRISYLTIFVYNLGLMLLKKSL